MMMVDGYFASDLPPHEFVQLRRDRKLRAHTLCFSVDTDWECSTFYVKQIENTCNAENAQQWFYILHKQCNALNAHQEEANSLSCARVDVF